MSAMKEFVTKNLFLDAGRVLTKGLHFLHNQLEHREVQRTNVSSTFWLPSPGGSLHT
jgi:hypothetical protein